MLFMLQKEVVARICAAPRHPDYGRLSVMVQYYCQTEYLLEVPPYSFSPPPEVDSAIVRLKPYVNLPYVAHNVELFATLVKAGFEQRRKTLRNSLRNLVAKEKFEALNLAPHARAEELSVAEWVQLSNAL